ncbi:MAG TPA: pentapeptide repeat-containing protein [Bacteriovoracaceae bacterium]|nr:pentapeptide repeat-containing protein [Bacteriovoracaceae bacterium]
MNTQATEIIYKNSHIQGFVIHKDMVALEAILGLAMTATLVQKATFQQVIFSECNFNCSEFQGVTFENCVFENCTFEFSHFRNCQFKNCNFTDCTWISSGAQKSLFEDCVLDAHLTKQVKSNDNLELTKTENVFENRLLALVA